MADDYTDDTQTTGAVTVGGSVRGQLETGGDRDWFAVTLVAGQTYQFDLEGDHTGAGTLFEPVLHGIYDAGGTYISDTMNDNGGSGLNSRVTFTATEDATYYVSAGSWEYRSGTYKLSVMDVTDGIPDDFTAGTGTAGMVTVDGSVTGEIEFYGDRDWFAVTLVAGQTYRFDLEGSGAGALQDPYLRGIYDTEGSLLSGTADNNSGPRYNSRVTFTATADDTYYVSAGANGDGEGTYRLLVRDVTGRGSDDFTAGTGTAGTVTVGGSVTGEMDFSGDRDWFAVTLVAGNTYLFDLERSGDGGALYDPHLRGIYDAEGNLIEGTTNNDGGSGRNSRVTFTATASDTYYVSASEHNGYRPLGYYTLSVRDITDDFTAGIDTAGVATVDGSVTAGIESGGDRDWFAVTLVEGQTYRFDLEGSWSGDGTLRDPHLRGIYDSEGNLIDGTTNDDRYRGYNSQVTFTAPADGTYYVSAGAHWGPSTRWSQFGNLPWEGDEGTYTLSVREIAEDLTATTGTTGTVAVGGSVIGDVQFKGDRDWFAVTLEADKFYQFDLEGSGAGALTDPHLRGIYDAGGNLIYSTKSGAYRWDSQAVFRATADGTYYVSAGAYWGPSRTSTWFGPLPWEADQGTYTLSVTDITDDVSNDLTAGIDTTGTVTVGSSATGEVDFAGDHDWFEVTLDSGRTYRFDVEGSRTNSGTLSDPYLYGIYDVDGDYIADTHNDDGGIGYNSRVTYAVHAGGTGYVSVGASGDGQGSYTLSVTDITGSLPDDFTTGTGTTGVVEVGDSATGEVDFGGDRDWFAVTLVAGNTYLFDLEGVWTSAGTLWDPYLRGIYDANGNYISGTRNDDGGSGYNSRVTFRATDDATYYVSAGAYGGREGAYTLSVTDITDSFPGDLTDGTGTTGTVAVGGSAATSEIDFVGDRDWFAVTLVAGNTYLFDLEGIWTDGGTLWDPYLRGIYDAGGNLLGDTTNDDGGSLLNSQLTFTATDDAVYYVSAGAYQDHLGTYALSVEEVM